MIKNIVIAFLIGVCCTQLAMSFVANQVLSVHYSISCAAPTGWGTTQCVIMDAETGKINHIYRIDGWGEPIK